MSREIRLSQKHGLGPMMSECYICGKTRDEIVLLGSKADRYERAGGILPRQMVFTIEPCDGCKAQGIALIEMTREAPDAEPTGRRCLMKEDAVCKFIQPGEVLDQILERRMCLLARETWEALGLDKIGEAQHG